MIQKIVNRKTKEVVYQGSISHDHGYWVRLYGDLSKLTKRHTSDRYKFAEYYGGKYLFVTESEKDDLFCSCCKRKLPKKDVYVPDEPYEVSVVEIIEGRDSYDHVKTFVVCFR